MSKSTLLYDCNKNTCSCQDAFGKWLDVIADWEWYATLTFRDPRNPKYPNWTQVGWNYAHRALRGFNHSLVMETGLNPAWVACMELQKRGVPHWHLLVANVESQRRMSWVDWWYKNYGIARILPYEKELGARYYLGKYLTKELSNIVFSPMVHVICSRQSYHGGDKNLTR